MVLIDGLRMIHILYFHLCIVSIIWKWLLGIIDVVGSSNLLDFCNDFPITLLSLYLLMLQDSVPLN